jgi:hypothetical protein
MTILSRSDRLPRWDRRHRSLGAAPSGRTGWRRSRPMVEALEGRLVLSLSAPPPIDEFAVPTA